MSNSIKKFISYGNRIANFTVDGEFISLGNTCCTSYYLKEVGLKEVSYPFDWVFSSISMIRNCIKDDFETFLDKSLMSLSDCNTKSGHSSYHDKLFNHKNPMKFETDYEYYQRCISRFRVILRKPTNYFITIIKEPEKRLGWSSGFLGKYSNLNQSGDDYRKLVSTINEYNPNSKFIFIEQYTESCTNIDVNEVERGKNYMVLKLVIEGSSNGVIFHNENDNFHFKLMLSMIHQN
jgi:hypothetical protein